VSSSLWAGIGMQNSIPIGDNAFNNDNSRHGTEFTALYNDPNLDMLWCWNYWGFSRIEAIFEFIKKYCPRKDKFAMVLGVFAGSDPPSASELAEVILTAQTYNMRISFAGDRNYTPDHFLVVEDLIFNNPTLLPCPEDKKIVTGKQQKTNLYIPWDDDDGDTEESDSVFQRF